MRNGLDESYTFLHRTLQEYLAAVHIAEMCESSQTDIVKNHCHRKHLSVVWRFLCGKMDYSKASTMNLFKKLMEPNDSFLQMQCAYESQCPKACDHVVSSLRKGDRINLSGSGFNFSPSDFTIFNYVIAKANKYLGREEHQIITLCCKQCKLSVAGAEALLKQIEHPFTLELSE